MTEREEDAQASAAAMQLREENARLKANVPHSSCLEAEQRNQRNEALLGRAVAALQEAPEHGYKCTNGDYVARAVPKSVADAIVTDPASVAAAESWRAQQEEWEELIEAAKVARDVLLVGKGTIRAGTQLAALRTNHEIAGERLASALAKVDARRGGGAK